MRQLSAIGLLSSISIVPMCGRAAGSLANEGHYESDCGTVFTGRARQIRKAFAMRNAVSVDLIFLQTAMQAIWYFYDGAKSKRYKATSNQ